jgi:hypothetical protein
MEVIKKQNGNVELRDGGVLVWSMPQLPTEIRPIDKDERDHVKLFQNDGRVEYLYVDEITETQIEPNAAVPFSGTVFDLADLMSDDFFFEVSGLNFKYNTDGYQSLDRIKQAYVTGTAGANFLRGRLIVVEQDILVDEMAIHVTSGAVGNSVAGVYSLDANRYPETKLFQVPTEFDLSVTGVQAISLSSPYLLKKGTYAVLELSSVSATYVRIDPANLINVRFDNFQTEQNVFGNPLAYTSTLPNTAPTLGLLSTQIPLVGFGIQ